MISKRSPRGFSIIELLTVIVLLAIIASAVITSSVTSYHDQLHAAAQVVAAELNHARSLAETNGSKYKITFDIAGNRMILQHSGTNNILDALPQSVFRNKKDPRNQHIIDFDDLDCIDNVSLYKVATLRESAVSTNQIEFGPLGETTTQYPTLIWLGAGPEDDRLYLLLAVNPVTGITTIGEYAGQSYLPLISEHEGLRDSVNAAPNIETQ
ncbi:MAG: type II secretion system protein [Pirellulales bacterium]|nr:type II secretion system protein [Pirellulales bacterium]